MVSPRMTLCRGLKLCCPQPRLEQQSALSSLKFHACFRNHCSLIESFLGVRNYWKTTEGTKIRRRQFWEQLRVLEIYRTPALKGLPRASQDAYASPRHRGCRPDSTNGSPRSHDVSVRRASQHLSPTESWVDGIFHFFNVSCFPAKFTQEPKPPGLALENQPSPILYPEPSQGRWKEGTLHFESP